VIITKKWSRGKINDIIERLTAFDPLHFDD